MKKLLFPLILFAFFPLFTQAANSPDAIAIRVMPNPNHYSPMRWYSETQKGKISGSPQALTVDGYEAIRDGRTVYVNVGNAVVASPPRLYTNIYLLSYTQNPEQATEDIFGQLLQRWKFNTNLKDAGYCSGVAASTTPCAYDIDCPLQSFCNSEKQTVVRDTIRMSRLVEYRLALEEYKKKKGRYPTISSGSYLSEKTISAWPSWDQTFAKEIGKAMPKDPINQLGPCVSAVYNFNSETCWDEGKRYFDDPVPGTTFEVPASSSVFVYESFDNGNRYNLCAMSESSFAPPDVMGTSPICAGHNNSAPQYTSTTTNTAPTITCGNMRGVTGQRFEGYVSVYDINRDPITWSFNSKPSWITNAFYNTANLNTRKIISTGPLAATTTGRQTVSFNAFDNKATTTKDCDIYIDCTPQCGSQQCGPSSNNCGTCGTGPAGNGGCQIGYTCSTTASYVCIQNPVAPKCTPNCTSQHHNCGDDGCGGNCGSCPSGQVCSNSGGGICQTNCVTNCPAGAQCGSDGCGGFCNGVSLGCTSSNQSCVNYQCVTANCLFNAVLPCTLYGSNPSTTPTPTCTDADNDGYGTAGSTGCAISGVDCLDSNSAVHPGANEICGNGIDEDCSGGDQSCVPGLPLSAVINIPTTTLTTYDFGQNITFDGTATGGTPPYTYLWRCKNISSVINTIGTNKNISINNLPINFYHCYFTATDSLGNSTTSPRDITQMPGITIRVITPLSISITSPLNGSAFEELDNINFSGNINGNWTPFTYTLNINGSQINGNLNASGPTNIYSTSTLPPGNQTFTLSASDQNSTNKSATVNFTINSPASVKAIILSPANKEIFMDADTVSFKSLVKGGTAPFIYRWQSDKDGIIGNTANFSTNNLSINTHQITLTVTDNSNNSTTAIPSTVDILPDAFDWSHKILPTALPAGGADWMSPVKDQGTVGICWAFAAAGTVEARHNIINNNPNLDIDLSEQYAYNCSMTYGFMFNIYPSNGVAEESCIAYKNNSTAFACNSKCDNGSTIPKLWHATQAYTPVGTATDVAGIRKEYKKSLINYGPLQQSMEIGDWKATTLNCNTLSGFHEVIIVGYNDSEQVWIVKNSWGANWNGNGYFKVHYGQCAIDTYMTQGSPISTSYINNIY